MHVDRRCLIKVLAGGALSVLPITGGADDAVIDLTWEDLIPDGSGGVLLESLREMGVVEHGQLSTGFEQPEADAVTDAYNGMTVRLPGYIVPLEFEATGVTAFLLVPYVGACIHVPPPPANQIVLVTTETPYEYEGFFDPVSVTGTFETISIGTELALIGYLLSADRIEDYHS